MESAAVPRANPSVAQTSAITQAAKYAATETCILETAAAIATVRVGTTTVAEAKYGTKNTRAPTTSALQALHLYRIVQTTVGHAVAG